jgi:hypothetical protein
MFTTFTMFTELVAMAPAKFDREPSRVGTETSFGGIHDDALVLAFNVLRRYITFRKDSLWRLRKGLKLNRG